MNSSANVFKILYSFVICFAFSLKFAIFYFLIRKSGEEKIFHELHSIFGTSQRHPTIEDLSRMKYLEMVLKECLRLYPAVNAIGRTLSEDTIFGNYEIPTGTIVEVNIYQLHRNPKYYSNPHEFDPEQFSTELSSKRHPFAFLPFSAGPRNCIGQKFAMLEEKLLITSLLRRYKIESLQNSEDVSKVAELVIRPGNGIKIKISKRNNIRNNNY